MKFIAILLLLLAACTTAQIDLPADSYGVEGANPRRWNQPLSFGEWRTSMVNEGTTRSFLADLDIVQIGKADQGYRMTLGKWLSSRAESRDLVARAARHPPAGSLDYARDDISGGPSLEVRSIQRVSGSSIPSGEPFGYE